MNYGLTGGIATGKSTVAKLFSKLGAIVIDADQVAREVVEPETQGAKLIREHFGDDFFTIEGKLDRAKLAEVIFADPVARQELNQILHPLIMREMQAKSDYFQKSAIEQSIIWDIPLLYEENLTHYVQKVIVVYVPEELQLTRLIERNKLSKSAAEERIHTQWPINKKMRLADFVIDNSGSVQQTERQVVALWKHLT